MNYSDYNVNLEESRIEIMPLLSTCHNYIHLYLNTYSGGNEYYQKSITYIKCQSDLVTSLIRGRRTRSLYMRSGVYMYSVIGFFLRRDKSEIHHKSGF